MTAVKWWVQYSINCHRKRSEVGCMCSWVLASRPNDIVFNSKARKYAKQEAYRTIEKQKNTFTKSGPCRLKLYETYGYETFTPLVMSAMRGMRRESLKFYLCLLELINEKRKTKYCIATMWIQPKIIFALMKSIGTCIRGNQSVFQQEKFEQSIKGNFFSEVLA